jgi:hypothetical protein
MCSKCFTLSEMISKNKQNLIESVCWKLVKWKEKELFIAICIKTEKKQKDFSSFSHEFSWVWNKHWCVSNFYTENFIILRLRENLQ